MNRTELSAFIITFALAFGVTAICIPIANYLGKHFGIVAREGGRHQNEGDRRRVSKLGGAAIYCGLTIAIIVAQFLMIPRFDPDEVYRLIGLIIGGTFIFVIGMLDDIYELNPLQLGIGQIIAAGIAITFSIFIESLNNPLTGAQTDPWAPLVTTVLTMLWFGLMMNTVNFMDGLDGLASGVTFIGGAMLFINSAFILKPAQLSVSLLPLALMGASFAFLLYNFYPARIFMGGGAVFLGYMLGALSIIGGAKMATILLVMGLPLMDLAWQIANRLLQGRNPMIGDRGHIHFRLLDIGFDQRRIVVSYYLFCALFGVLTLVTTSRLFKFIAFGSMLLLIILGFMLLSRFSQSGSSKSS
jgi:UDP-GlcNAc:undecaprenyl-phosphate GlcNAc-1-phosphate transferase